LIGYPQVILNTKKSLSSVLPPWAMTVYLIEKVVSEADENYAFRHAVEASSGDGHVF
jgi:hypothetical protein